MKIEWKIFWIIPILVLITWFFHWIGLSYLPLSVLLLITFITLLITFQIDVSKIAFGNFQIWFKEADKNLHQLYCFFARAALHVYTRELTSLDSKESFKFQKSLIDLLKEIKLSDKEIERVNQEWYTQGRIVLMSKIKDLAGGLYCQILRRGEGGLMTPEQIQRYDHFKHQMDIVSSDDPSCGNMKSLLQENLRILYVEKKFDFLDLGGEDVRNHATRSIHQLNNYLSVLQEFEHNHTLSLNSIDLLHR